MDWNNYLTLADELAKRTDNEAALRSAISRAYYAAFHAVRSYLQSYQGLTENPGEGSHQAVIKRLEMVTAVNPLRKYRNLYKELKVLKRRRETADYDNVEKAQIDEIVGEQMATAAEFLGSVILLTKDTESKKASK